MGRPFDEPLKDHIRSQSQVHDTLRRAKIFGERVQSGKVDIRAQRREETGEGHHEYDEALLRRSKYRPLWSCACGSKRFEVGGGAIFILLSVVMMGQPDGIEG